MGNNKNDKNNEKKNEQDNLNFMKRQSSRSNWILCLDRLFELCFPSSNLSNQSSSSSIHISCVDQAVQNTVANQFLECLRKWSTVDQLMIENYLFKMLHILKNINNVNTNKDEDQDALTALNGLIEVLEMYTSKTNPLLSYSALYTTIIQLTSKSKNKAILEQLLETLSYLSSKSETPSFNNDNDNDSGPNNVHLTCQQCILLHENFLVLEQKMPSTGTQSRLGKLWKWMLVAVNYYKSNTNPVILIKNKELIKIC